ncbi:uncharacterized protein Gasu_46240 [Galdieria sulphuraria]|uniref:Uncharacterized protein n=1 Tax=Galdieria sulphuraria TaxID=130081 RepID=M2XWJ2_GALSU|nr:uncharacterized protein Gasu_46240 [Galdieria sulphuraria]EME27799.1 hypothetical protein Gasu_46240 [Galdieria sulphuraria]|eukprot:XP_005704319.1 hypothetical protein Gasu_46240 [Galdieria sulphuraria]
MGRIAQQPIFATSSKCPENALWKFPLVTHYGPSLGSTEWHSICVYGNANDKQLPQLLCKGKRLYIEGDLSKRMTMSMHHQVQVWYEVVVAWDRKGVIIPIGI